MKGKIRLGITTSEYAIQANNLSINVRQGLTKVPILRELSLSVPTGCIYGLIGPSGCGKTTFQRCILGHHSISNGELRVFDNYPGYPGSGVPGPLVGHMPQDISLDPDLTVNELITFFGRLNGLTELLIQERSKELLAIMDIHNLDRLVSTCSIGQQRRVSFVCSLLHRPPLVLLDEPTVGSDPMAVKRIWDYLLDLRRNYGVTIVLTTHYLEEVNRADYFAFMSSGQVIVEDNPKAFKLRQGQNSLEAAVLHFHLVKIRKGNDLVNNNKDDDDGLVDRKQFTRYSTYEPIKIDGTRLTYPKSISLLTWRYWSRWKRSSIYEAVGLSVLLVFIIMVMMVLFGHFPINLKIGLVNHDLSGNLTDSFVNLILKNSDDWVIVNCIDETEARKSVEAGTLNAYLVIMHGFTEKLKDWSVYNLEDHIRGNFPINRLVTLHQDTTNRFIADVVEIVAERSLNTLLGSFNETKSQSFASDGLFQVDPVYNVLDNSKKLASTTIVSIKQFLQSLESYTTIFVMNFMVYDFRSAMNERLAAAGLKQSETIIAITLLSTCLLVPLFSVSLTCLVMITDLPTNGSLLFIVAIITALTICGAAKGLLIGWMTSSPIAANFINCGYGFASLFMAAIIWPYESIPYFIRPIFVLLPFTYSSDSTVRSMVYGQSIFRYEVYSGLVFVIIHAIISMLIVFFFIRKWK